MLKTQLAAAGYGVIACASGGEALNLLAREEPNVLVLDLVLPDMDGVEIVARLKGEHALRHIPIVVVTGAEMDRARREMLEGFCVPGLAKPWRQEELLRCVEEAVVGEHYLRR
jgi:CheY-like chemotaxis protein